MLQQVQRKQKNYEKESPALEKLCMATPMDRSVQQISNRCSWFCASTSLSQTINLSLWYPIEPVLIVFCGYPGYDAEKLPFDPSLIEYFCKQLIPEMQGETNEILVRDVKSVRQKRQISRIPLMTLTTIQELAKTVLPLSQRSTGLNLLQLVRLASLTALGQISHGVSL